MSLKIQNATLGYSNLVIEKNAILEEVISKLEKFSEFVDGECYVAVDFTLLSNELVKQISLEILNKIQDLKLKIIFIRSNQELGKKYNNLINNNLDNTKLFSENNLIVFNKTKIIDSTVRSGEEIINQGDIIVNALISHGAEIKSSGNIHVYGECRGKLFAGTNGDESARIYVNNFKAESVGIANVRYVFEDEIPDKLKNKSVIIYLDEKKRINITPMKI